MKGRPRRVENEVAKHLSKHLAKYDVGKVERIPVLGRTGPDIEVDPVFRLAVDVKSRKANPKSYKLYGSHLQEWSYEGWWQIGCRLCDLDLLFDTENVPMHLDRKGSSTVAAWLFHMSEWTGLTETIVKETGKEMVVADPDMIPALVLHWPGTPVKNSTFVIYEPHRRFIDDRRKRIDDLRHGASNNQRDDGCPNWAEG